MITSDNSELANAFPAAVRNDALIALSRFPEDLHKFNWHTFSVRVADQEVSIPVRVYHEPALIDWRLSSLQRELADCLLTRHHNGYVRQGYLQRIVRSPNVWIPPFVVQLVGEYVIEILQVIDNNLGSLNLPIYEHFVQSNPEFIALTEHRVMSYWNENYRRPAWDDRTVYERDEYVGFKLIRFFKSLAQNGHSS
jgi:hypothetical protein